MAEPPQVWITNPQVWVSKPEGSPFFPSDGPPLLSVDYSLVVDARNSWLVRRVAGTLPAKAGTMGFIRTSIHREYDLPYEIGAMPSKIKLTAPMPWEGIVFMMNTCRDQVTRVPRP